jgi:hypothetical protein
MRENFIITINNKNNWNYLIKPTVCIILAVAIVYPIVNIQTIEGILCIILLFLIFYVIALSMTSENLSNELPSTLYPSIPHTGLDGISLNTYVAGMSSPKSYT